MFNSLMLSCFCDLLVFFFFLFFRLTPRSTLFPYTTLFRSARTPKRRSRPASRGGTAGRSPAWGRAPKTARTTPRSEEHTSELQSLRHLVCRLLLEKKKKKQYRLNM